MPTGYTAAIKDGITFKRFLMDCAKAFGACITMRDDPMDKPIPEEFEVDDYHIKALERAKEELSKYSLMSLDEAEQKALSEYCNSKKEYEEKLKENKELLHKYQTMLNQANEWIPPTSEHVGIKEFMIDQIKGSIEFDCMGDYYKKALKEIKKLSGFEWRGQRIDMTIRDIIYHAEKYEEEKARVKSRNEWIKTLRKSVDELQ